MTLESEMGLAKWSILDFILTIFLQSSVRKTVQTAAGEKYQALRLVPLKANFLVYGRHEQSGRSIRAAISNLRVESEEFKHMGCDVAYAADTQGCIAVAVELEVYSDERKEHS